MTFLSHSDLQRLSIAARSVEEAEAEIDHAGDSPDPVEIRRCLVRAANAFRRAAGALDDNGRLTE